MHCVEPVAEPLELGDALIDAARPLADSRAQSARSGTRFCGSRASSAATSVSDSPIFCAKTMKAIRRSTARG